LIFALIKIKANAIIDLEIKEGKNMKNLEIQKVLVLSVFHIEENVYDRLKEDPANATDLYSTTIWVGYETINEELAAILLFAKEKDCDYIKFDEDANTISNFSTFEW
jgi:hypothetical protein